LLGKALFLITWLAGFFAAERLRPPAACSRAAGGTPAAARPQCRDVADQQRLSWLAVTPLTVLAAAHALACGRLVERPAALPPISCCWTC